MSWHVLASPAPKYATIYDGEWLDDTRPYHVIHRIASYPDVHGIFDSIIHIAPGDERLAYQRHTRL